MDLDRTQLLGKSGVGVHGPWLVIALVANVPIWLDLRVLDAIEVRQEELAPEGEEREPRWDVVLVCGDLEVAMFIEDGCAAAEQLVRAAESLTREGTALADLHSTNEVRVNDEARATTELRSGDIVDLGDVGMLFAQPGGRSLAPPTPGDPTEFLFVGADAVRKRDGYIEIGTVAFRTNEVHEYSLQGANLPLPGGRSLQAAMALLVVAVAEREEQEARPGWLGMRLEATRRAPRVRDVAAGSAADRAGIRVGDEWVSFAGSSASLRVGPTPAPIAEHLAFRVRRDAAIVELEVALASDGQSPECFALLDHEAPSFTARRLDGGELSLGDLAGHVIVLDFFEASSEECTPKLLRLSVLNDKYPELRVVGVDVEGGPESPLASRPIRYPVVCDDDGTIASSYGIPAPLALVVIDKNHVVRKVELGVGDFDALEAELVDLMK